MVALPITAAIGGIGGTIAEMRGDGGVSGTQNNPDGTVKDPTDQLDQIRKARDKHGKLIENIDKSEQGARNSLDDLDGLSLEEILELYY